MIQMTKKKTINEVCNPDGSLRGCNLGSGYKVEAVLSVDERGQMVLPKDVREKAGINTGSKLALISCSTSPTGSENHLSPLRFQTFNRKVF
jgi:AbrB family looped-hinge helix DNA binding protein